MISDARTGRNTSSVIIQLWIREKMTETWKGTLM